MSTINLDDITLAVGAHQDPAEGLCLLEAVAYVAGEPHTDHPKCVSPVLGAYGRRLNDRVGDEDRQKLKPYITAMLGTADDGHDTARGYLATDWAIRTAVPRLLRAANLTDLATRLEVLAPVVDDSTARAARREMRDIREHTWDARVAANKALRTRIEEELRKRGFAVAAAVAVDAAAAADADFSYGTPAYWKVRNAAAAVIRNHLNSSDSALAKAIRTNTAEAIELLGRMIDPNKATAA